MCCVHKATSSAHADVFWSVVCVCVCVWWWWGGSTIPSQGQGKAHCSRQPREPGGTAIHLQLVAAEHAAIRRVRLCQEKGSQTKRRRDLNQLANCKCGARVRKGIHRFEQRDEVAIWQEEAQLGWRHELAIREKVAGAALHLSLFLSSYSFHLFLTPPYLGLFPGGTAHARGGATVCNAGRHKAVAITRWSPSFA